MLQQTTRIPKTPEFVEGVINLRGSIIPIIDGRKKFNLSSEINLDDKDVRIMILEVEDDTIGLIVDSVSEVIHLDTNEIEPPPIDVGDDSEFLLGVGKFNGRLLILLNPQKFLTMAESSDIKNFSTVTEVIKQTNELGVTKKSKLEYDG